MASKIQVSLDFLANTTQAKNSIEQLTWHLREIQQTALTGVGSEVEADLRKASDAATQLKVHLQEAVNVDTGRLDLNKFNLSIAQSGTSLTTLINNLRLAGTEGDLAFSNLAAMIATAEMPTFQLTGAISKLSNTLMNTGRWMLSSGVLRLAMSTLSGAWSYIQDLDESLNRIQIVTKKSTDEMARFAVQANKAAQSLSTTTTEYTDASLIYYQQGLDDEEVKNRTNTTIKMANVTGQSAETVSDQMTAIWNNFYDGSQSIESYADSLTALGAATASSSAEIAEGMEKFAAVANTIELSYDYAAAAVATVVAQTRQSADIVGTAFKTIFARMEGLKTDGSADDGTTLNQYSQALADIGVSIKDQAGNLKDMNTILDETGAKWEGLTKAQQVGLAQTVAGLRQYQQFIALMDNFEEFKTNVAISENAEGELEAQQAVYEKSWQASIDRVRSSAEGIYSTLIDDDFFKEMNNNIAEFLKSLKSVIDGMGGLRTIVIGLLSFAMGALGPKISPFLDKIKNDMLIISGHGDKIYQNTLNQVRAAMQQTQTETTSSETAKLELDLNERLIAAKEAMISVYNKLNSVQQKSFDQAVEGANRTIQSIAKESEALEKERNQIELNIAAWERQRKANEASINISARSKNLQETVSNINRTDLQLSHTNFSMNEASGIRSGFGVMNHMFQDIGEFMRVNLENGSGNFTVGIENALKTVIPQIDTFREKMIDIVNSGNTPAQFENLKGQILQVGEGFTQIIDDPIKLQEALNELAITTADSENRFTILDNVLNILENGLNTTELNVNNNVKAFAMLGNILGETGIEQLPPKLQAAVKEATQLSAAMQKNENATNNLNKKVEALKANIANLGSNMKPMMTMSNVISSVASSMGQLYMAVYAVQNLGSIWSNEDLNLGQKLTQSLMSLSMLIPSVMGMWKTFSKIAQSDLMLNSNLSTAIIQRTHAEEALNKARINGIPIAIAENEIEIIKNSTDAAGNKLTEDKIKKKLEEYLITKLGIDAKAADEVATQLQNGATLKDIILTSLGIKTKTTENIVLTEHTKKQIADTIALKAKWAIVLLVVAAIAALIAVTVLLIKAIADQETAEQKANRELKEQQELLVNTKKAYDEAKKSVDDLISSWEQLSKAQDTLDKLIVGSEEWNKNLLEVNTQVMNLIDKYPTLAKYLSTDVNGRMTIASAGYKEILEQQKDQVSTLVASYQAQRINVLKAKQRVSDLKYAKEIQSNAYISDNGYLNEQGQWENRPVYDAEYGFSAKQLNINYNNAVDGIRQALLDGAIIINNGQAETNQELSELFNTYGITKDQWAGISGQPEILSQILGETKSINETIKAAKITGATEILSQTEAYKNSDYKEAMSYLGGDLLENLGEMAYDIFDQRESLLFTQLDDYALNGRRRNNDELGRKNKTTNKTMFWSSYFGDVDFDEGNVVQNWINSSGYDFSDTVKSQLKNIDEEDLMRGFLASYLEKNIEEIGGLDSISGIRIIKYDVNSLDYYDEQGDKKSLDYNEYYKQIASYTDNYLRSQAIEYLSSDLSDEVNTYAEQLKATGLNIQNNGSLIASKIVYEKNASENTPFIADLSSMTREDVNELREQIKNVGTSLDDGAKEWVEGINRGIEKFEVDFAQANVEASQAWKENYEQNEATELDKALQTAGMTKEDFDAYVETFKAYNSELGLTEEQYEKVAKQALETANGLKKVNDVMTDKDNKDVFNQMTAALKSSNKELQNQIKQTNTYQLAIGQLTSALSDWLGVSLEREKVEKLWSDGVISDALEEDAYKTEKGVQAIKKLQLAAAEQIVVDMHLNTEDFPTQGQVLQDLIDATMNPTVTIGTEMDIGPAIEAMNELVQRGAINAEQAQSYWNNVGYQPEFGDPVKAWVSTEHRDVHRTTDLEGRPMGGFIDTWTQNEEISVPQWKNTGSPTPFTGGKAASSPIPKSSGKSGGGGKNKEQKTNKDEFYSNTKQTQSLNKEMERYSKLKNQAYGNDKIKYIDKEIEGQEKLIKLYKEGQQIALDQIADNKATLKSMVGLTDEDFDEYGNLTQKAYEKVIDKVDELKNAEKEAESTAINDALKDFENGVSTYQDLGNQILDAQNEIISSINEKVQIQLEIATEKLKVASKQLEYLLDHVDNKGYNAASRMILNRQMAENNRQTHQNNIEAVNDMLTKRGQTWEDLQGEWWKKTDEDGNPLWNSESIKEMNDLLVDSYESLDAYKESIQEYVDTFDTWADQVNEQFDNLDKRIEFSSNTIEHYINLIDLIGQETLGITNEEMAEIEELQLASAQTNLKSAEARAKEMTTYYEGLEKQYNEATDEYQKELLRKQMEEARDEMISSVKAAQEALVQAIELAGDVFENRLKRAAKEFEKAMYGGQTADEFNTALEWQEQKAKEYVEDYKKIYELSKLNRQIESSIDNTSNVKAKQILRDLEKEIADYSAEHAEMSQYDLDYLQKRYNLRMAEIAMEEAQNAKAKVRLTRDSEGNYGYTYTADEDKQTDAIQKYEDALYALQELNTNYANEMAKNQSQLAQQLVEYINGLDKTDEHYQEKVEAAQQHYYELMEYYSSESDKALAHNRELYENEWRAYSEKTGYQISDNKKFVDNLNETNAGIAGHLETGESFFQRFKDAIGSGGKEGERSGYLGEIADGYDGWKATLDEVLKLSGKSLDDFKDDLKNDLFNDDNSVANQLNDIEGDINKVQQTEDKALQDMLNDLRNQLPHMIVWANAYETQINKFTTAWENAKTAYDQYIENLKKNPIPDTPIPQQTGTPATITPTDKSGGDGGGGNPTYIPPDNTNDVYSYGLRDKTTKQVVTSWKDPRILFYKDNKGNYVQVQGKVSHNFISENSVDRFLNRYYYKQDKNYFSIANAFERVRKKSKDKNWNTFDTGGYTGEWGPDGRLAMLHQKELVLNANDTKNFLSAVDILRDITQAIDLQAIAAAGGLGSPTASTIDSSGQVIDQHIEISASFPNAINHNEIEEAFRDLANVAAQYAQRK